MKQERGRRFGRRVVDAHRRYIWRAQLFVLARNWRIDAVTMVDLILVESLVKFLRIATARNILVMRPHEMSSAPYRAERQASTAVGCSKCIADDLLSQPSDTFHICPWIDLAHNLDILLHLLQNYHSKQVCCRTPSFELTGQLTTVILDRPASSSWRNIFLICYTLLQIAWAVSRARRNWRSTAGVSKYYDYWERYAPEVSWIRTANNIRFIGRILLCLSCTRY